MLYFFLRGTPFIYQGQELGMDNFVRHSIDEFNDVSSIDNYYRSIEEGYSAQEALNFVNLRSRDNSRTPFQWDTTKNYGFSDNSPCLEFTNSSVNAKEQNDQEISVLSFYKRMIALRNHSEYSQTLIYGDFNPLDTDKNIIGYQRIGNELIEVYVNLDNEGKELNTSGEILLSNYQNTEINDQKISLFPYQAVVLRKD